MAVLFRFVWMVVSFLLVEVCIFLPLYMLGLIMFPFAYRYDMIVLTESNINQGQTILAFKDPIWNEWLGNREDGLLPEWWAKERGGSAYGWFIRNPVTNMRFWPVISTLPNPEKTGFIGTLDHVPSSDETGWFFCWEGLYAGFLYQGKRFGCWFGWKTNPRDRKPEAPRDYRYYGLGTAAQIWRVK
jgi:hypothetical protein